MRYLALILALWCAAAQAQVVGWIDCRHDAPGERFGYIKVALMDGNTERRSSTRQFEKLKPGGNLIQFSELVGPAKFTGMRLSCEIISPPGVGLVSEETQYTLNWTNHLTVASGQTIKPALALNLVQISGGWRAYIGKAP